MFPIFKWNIQYSNETFRSPLYTYVQHFNKYFMAYLFLALLGKAPSLNLCATLCNYCTIVYILHWDLFNEFLLQLLHNGLHSTLGSIQWIFTCFITIAYIWYFGDHLMNSGETLCPPKQRLDIIVWFNLNIVKKMNLHSTEWTEMWLGVR